MSNIEKLKSDKEIEKELRDLPEWEQVKRQFSPLEQRVFMEHWVGLVKQFKGDIVKSEYMEIVEAIKLELLANRCLEDQISCKASIENLEQVIQSQMDLNKDARNYQLIEGAESKIVSNRQAIASSRREYLSLVEQKDKIFKSLKMTREQRYKLREDSKTSFMDWCRVMIEDKERRKQVGIDMEKMRLSVEQERKRLSKNHVYMDGEIDKAILDSDTIMLEDE